MNHTYTRSAPWGHAVTIGLDAGEPDARQTAPSPRSSRKMRPSHASGTADGRPTRPERAAGRSARATPRQSADGGRRSRGRPPDGSRTTESNTRALSHRPPSGRSCASRRVRTRGRPHPDLNLAESAPNPRNRVTPSSGTPTFRPISQPRMGASRSRRGRRFSARACRPGRGCRPRASSMHRGSVPQALLRADRFGTGAGPPSAIRPTRGDQDGNPRCSASRRAPDYPTVPTADPPVAAASATAASTPVPPAPTRHPVRHMILLQS